MNSTPGPKAAEPRDASIARADERLTHAYEEIVRADDELARLSEQVARMERNTARAPSSVAGATPPPGKRPHGALIGLPLAACVVIAALVWQSSFGGGARPVAIPSPPPLASSPSLPPENPQLAAEPALPAVQLAATGPAPAQATPAVQTAPQAAPHATPKATPMAQSAPQDAAPTSAAPTSAAPTSAAPTVPNVPTAAAAPPDHTQLLQTMARDLATLQRSIEQLKATQQQAAGDTAKEIAELKASQEEIKRGLAKVSEQSPSRASPPAQASQPVTSLRKPERTSPPPRARARPRIPPGWYYDDDW